MLGSFLIALAYIVTGRLGMLVAVPPGNVTAVWIPSGIAIVGLLLAGPRIWPGIWMGSFLVNLWFMGDIPGPIKWFSHGAMAFGIAVGSTLQALVLRSLMVRSGIQTKLFEESAIPFRFLGIAVLACLLAPSIGSLTLMAGGLLQGGQWFMAWLTWWLGDLSGIVLILPLWLACWNPREHGRSLYEVLVAFAVLVVASLAIFASGPGQATLVFTILPITTWIAFRFSPREVGAAILILSAVAILGTARGGGPFAGRPVGESLLLLQAFVLTIAVSKYALSATVTNHRRAQEHLAALLSRTHDRLHETEVHRAWSEARFQTVIDIVGYGIIFADEAGHVLEANPAARKMFAVPEDVSLVGRPVDVLIPQGLREEYRKDLERFLATGESRITGRPVELVGRRWDGQEFPVELCLTTWTERSRRYLAGFFFDLTERKVADNRFRGLLEAAPDAMVIVDGTGQIVFVNSQSERMFGYTRAELLGKRVEMLVPHRFSSRHGANRAGYMDHPHPRPMGAGLDLYGLRKDGTEFPVEISLSPLETPEGILVSSAIRDITDRKRAEEVLRRGSTTKQLLEEVGAAANHAKSSDEAFQFVLDRLCQTTRWPLGHVYSVEEGSPPALVSSGLWHVDGGDRFLLFMNAAEEHRLALDEGLPGRVLAEGRPAWGEEDTSSIWGAGREEAARLAGLKSSLAFPVLVDNRVVAVFEFLSDERPGPSEQLLEAAGQIGMHLGRTVERQQAEEYVRKLNAELELRVEERTAELRRSNEDLQQFAYVASHDLQEPLRMIASYTSLIEKRYKDRLDAKGAQFLRFTMEGASRTQRLINDLLAYSRVGSGRLEFSPTDCNAVLDRSLANLRLAITESRAKVVHDPLPTVMAVPNQLVLLFQNLIANAIKFRREVPPLVEVKAEPIDGSWAISVRDNGIGIEARHAQRIFVIFQRLHSREEYPGTGIGLAICKKIVEQHGGTIRVESTPGSGSIFTFTLPREGRRSA